MHKWVTSLITVPRHIIQKIMFLGLIFIKIYCNDFNGNFADRNSCNLTRSRVTRTQDSKRKESWIC